MNFEIRDVLIADLHGGPVQQTATCTSMSLTPITCYINTGICPSGTLSPTIITTF